MRLTTRSRYGTWLLLDIALHQDRGWVCTADIASRQNISQKYIEKLIVGLRKGGLVTSKRGPLGGHKLAKAPNTITVGDVVRLLEETETPSTHSGTAKNLLDSSSCESMTQFVWAKASSVLMQTLDSFDLGGLISRKG